MGKVSDLDKLMKPTEIRERLAKGESAAKISAEHWKENIRFFERYVEWPVGHTDGNTCALCIQIKTVYGAVYCRYCPLAAVSLGCDEDMSLWYQTWAMDDEQAVSAARDLVKVLESVDNDPCQTVEVYMWCEVMFDCRGDGPRYCGWSANETVTLQQWMEGLNAKCGQCGSNLDQESKMEIQHK